ncbi:MAG: hypothetical protein LBE13_13480 [Bacteroidales bacterium]|jgi:hypothetical protein|nr:hypothetical protein [Bacteroidales bacterium]
MTDMNKAFLDFNEGIKLTKSSKSKILASRDAVREKVRRYFKEELKVNQPKFQIQGSFSIFTALNPTPDNEVDLDDGVYLQHISGNEEEWPTPKEAHVLVLDALDGHTQDGCEDKSSCVRVIYRNDYHLDMPVYIMKDDKAFLAQTKLNEWQHSDAKDFKDWFYQYRTNEQTSRIVRYLKGWRDYREYEFTSIELTILAINHFSPYEDRDDLSLMNTLTNIYNSLNISRSIKKPVAPWENLWEELSESEIDKRLNQLKKLHNDISTATNGISKNSASIILREQFGDRFPLLEDDKPKPIPNHITGSKPWRL